MSTISPETEAEKAAQAFARKTVAEDSPGSDWVNIAHDFLAGAAWQREQMLTALKSEEARHETVDLNGGRVWKGGKDHIGPTLMAACLWARWLELKGT